MIRLTRMIEDMNDKLPINKREFINWFLDSLKKEGDSSQNLTHPIENYCYAYYRKGKYSDLNSYYIIKGILACVDLSVYWHEQRFEPSMYSLPLRHHRDSLWITRFSYRFLCHLKYDTSILWRIDDFIYRKLKSKELICQEEVFDIVCENFGDELIREFEMFCNENIYFRYSSLENKKIKTVPSDLVVGVFATVFNQYRNLDSINRLDLVLKLPSMNMVQSDFEGYYHVFNFFGDLKRRAINKVTKEQGVKEIEDYCTKLMINGNRNLKKTLLNSLLGSKSIFKDISNLFEKRKAINDLSYEKYKAAYCHCIVLFENDDDFKQAFLGNKFDKLDSTTSDILNIYYCEQDSEGKLSGYNTINKFEKEGGIDIGEENLPAIIVWYEDINKLEVIRLFDLDIQNCFYVIRKFKVTFKQEIRNVNSDQIHQQNNSAFLNAVQIANEEVQNLLQKQKEKEIQKNINFYGNIEGLQQNYGNAQGTQNIAKQKDIR